MPLPSKTHAAWFPVLFLLTACIAPDTTRSLSSTSPAAAATAPATLPALAELSFENAAAFESAMITLAKAELATLPEKADADQRFRLRLLAGEYEAAIADIDTVRQQRKQAGAANVNTVFVQYEVWARARMRMMREPKNSTAEDAAFKLAFAEVFGKFDDRLAFDAFGAFLGSSAQQAAQVQAALTRAQAAPENAALRLPLLRSYQVYRSYRDLLSRAEMLMAEDDLRRYVVKDDVLIRTPQGATLSATLMHKASGPKQPALMMFNIYADMAQIRNNVREMAANGYAGIIVDARGKRLSHDTIAPYEHEGEDAHAAIDWISKQDWNDGRVAMMGGSYSGFVQWAAARHAHPALKAIVPTVAAIPGQGVPMENNVFINANYAWPFYVTNNRLLDNDVYFDRDRWQALSTRWFESGRPYREIDAVDGTPNPWLQKWLQHPGFDAYWQRMIPVAKQYANINIPVLSITGYFDDGQISALQYYHEHLRHNPRADHTLLMGPWDHVGAQGRPSPVVNEYRVEPAAMQPISAIIYQWLDHQLKGGARPALLADKVNLQVMGSNAWQHAPSLKAAAPETLRFHLHTENGKHRLSEARHGKRSAHLQTVDLSDRKTQNNVAYYPWPVERESLETGDAPVFVSAPLTQGVDLIGSFSADLVFRTNKRDVDIGLTLYEQMSDGRHFHLGYFLGRASYARDPAKRELLTPGAVSNMSAQRVRMTARRVVAGSRLVLVADVNKNQHAQVNHGTGKDVSDESAEDGKIPLRIEWLSDSVLRVPVRKVTSAAGG